MAHQRMGNSWNTVVLGGKSELSSFYIACGEDYYRFLPAIKSGTATDIFYYHTNHLGSTAFVTDQNQNVTQGFLYAPFGEITTEFNATFGNDIIPKYSFNAKELDEETGMYYYEARYYKPPVFTSRDPMFEKYFWMTPYAYCANNPVKYVDPSGEEISEHIDKYGNMIANYNDGDNSVYLHTDGTTKADIDAQIAFNKNTGGNGIKIGELGGTIDASVILQNKLTQSAGIAMLYGLYQFYGLVKQDGIWDLKNNKNTIWGVAWAFDHSDENNRKNNTMFTYNGYSMDAADVGNFHYGVTGKFLCMGIGVPDIILETAAGRAEIQKNEKEGKHELAAEGRKQFHHLKRPYGDTPNDNKWIRRGIRHSSSIK